MSALRNATWAFSNFCQGKPRADLTLLKDSFKPLCDLLVIEDPKVLDGVCWSFAHLIEGPDERITAVVDGTQGKVVQGLIRLLAHRSDKVLTPAFRAVGNLSTGNDAHAIGVAY